MPSEDVVLLGEDGRYLVKARSAYVSCLRCLPSKSQPRGDQRGGGEARSVVEGMEEQPVRSQQRDRGEQGAGLWGWETPH